MSKSDLTATKLFLKCNFFLLCGTSFLIRFVWRNAISLSELPVLLPQLKHTSRSVDHLNDSTVAIVTAKDYTAHHFQTRAADVLHSLVEQEMLEFCVFQTVLM